MVRAEMSLDARSRVAAAVSLVVLSLVPCHAASECGDYEDGDRATHRPIAWRDFKAPDALRGAVAYIATSIAVEPIQFELTLELDGTWSARPTAVCVRAFVLKRGSGFVRREARDRDLAHEQGHFDITEIFARALAERLGRIRENAASPEAALEAVQLHVDRATLRTLAAWRAQQALYDLETECSARAERRWARWIAQQLATRPRQPSPATDAAMPDPR
jgi:hypothetical protein